MENNISSWTVFFLFEPITTVYTTLLTERDDVPDEELIMLAAMKLEEELDIDVYALAEKLGKNRMTDSGDWIVIEHNDTSATDQELAVLKVNK
ncbi:hypothetical protein BH780_gp214 [Bacillus phage Eldridge]|uniref:Uncharacterized protein n=1 Tax=Bacillus phage Eldridge TaxID=1776293 RepID=A0A0Y0AUZ6_9CAUD|nr:hypothetical protein BH780_gp214 [Bacillus phage Eldridge]AMB18797.1 hypothetical protein Eldridge_0217 [Bacillus phage Eldridge]